MRARKLSEKQLKRPANNMKVPTFVPSLDSIMKGGIPEGSSILLLGEPGAGNFEFALTSAANLSRAIEGKIPRELSSYDIKILEGILFVTFSKPSSEIIRILSLSLESGLAESLQAKLKILDLSKIYYLQTQIPSTWTGAGSIKERENIIQMMIKGIEAEGSNKLIIIDSMTDLITGRFIDEKTMFDISRGLSRACKMWNSIVYVLLTQDVVDIRSQNILMEIYDGTLVFKWNAPESTSKRRRYMIIPKFTGVLPLIERERIERFDTEFDYNTGMIVLNTTRVK
jgi:KaiC/GvpD/RAD55 family RecA-like ATPase